MDEYQERIELVIKASRHISADVAGIIIDYVGHPYYSIAKRIKKRCALSLDWQDVFRGREVRVIDSETKDMGGRFRICRHGWVMWNIKYLIPKSLFTKGIYIMELRIGYDVSIKEKCIIEEEGVNVVLWTPSTSLPIPICNLACNFVDVKIIEETRGVHDSGILTYESLHLKNEMSALLKSNTITVFDAKINGLAEYVCPGTYDSLPELEIFPGIKAFPSNLET